MVSHTQLHPYQLGNNFRVKEYILCCVLLHAKSHKISPGSEHHVTYAATETSNLTDFEDATPHQLVVIWLISRLSLHM